MRKRVLFCLVALLLGAVLCSCSGLNADRLGEKIEGKDYRAISAEEAHDILDEDGVILADVREEDEYASGHIEGSINLPLSVLLDEMDEKLPNKDAIIILYCGSGQRSAKAAGMLARKGYNHVFDMGGMDNWTF